MRLIGRIRHRILFCAKLRFLWQALGPYQSKSAQNGKSFFRHFDLPRNFKAKTDVWSFAKLVHFLMVPARPG